METKSQHPVGASPAAHRSASPGTGRSEKATRRSLPPNAQTRTGKRVLKPLRYVKD